jgi:hypothetical protein
MTRRNEVNILATPAGLFVSTDFKLHHYPMLR